MTGFAIILPSVCAQDKKASIAANFARLTLTP